MKQYPVKEKIVNSQANSGTTDTNAKKSVNDKVKKKDDSKKPNPTLIDLKGKKVDGDPELESDQPIDQLH